MSVGRRGVANRKARLPISLLELHADNAGKRLEIARRKAVRLVSDHWVEINATARR